MANYHRFLQIRLFHAALSILYCDRAFVSQIFSVLFCLDIAGRLSELYSSVITPQQDRAQHSTAPSWLRLMGAKPSTPPVHSLRSPGGSSLSLVMTTSLPLCLHKYHPLMTATTTGSGAVSQHVGGEFLPFLQPFRSPGCPHLLISRYSWSLSVSAGQWRQQLQDTAATLPLPLLHLRTISAGTPTRLSGQRYACPPSPTR